MFDGGRPYPQYGINEMTPISGKRAALALARTISPMRQVSLSDSCLALPVSKYTGASRQDDNELLDKSLLMTAKGNNRPIGGNSEEAN